MGRVEWPRVITAVADGFGRAGVVLGEAFDLRAGIVFELSLTLWDHGANEGLYFLVAAPASKSS